MRKLTENGYAADIRRKCEALGTWRPEFERAQRRLAKIYVRLDDVEGAYAASGSVPLVTHVNKAGAENLMRNPLLAEIDILYDQALTYERELGLTSAALKKINESAMRSGKASPLDELTNILKMA